MFDCTAKRFLFVSSKSRPKPNRRNPILRLHVAQKDSTSFSSVGCGRYKADFLLRFILFPFQEERTQQQLIVRRTFREEFNAWPDLVVHVSHPSEDEIAP